MEGMKTDTLDQLKERAKELQCLYKVIELMRSDVNHLGKLFYKLLHIIPSGWQYPGICSARVVFENQKFTLPDFEFSKWSQTAEIIVDNNILGELQVFYSSNHGMQSPFLTEEQKLLNSIAHKLSDYIFNDRLVKTMEVFNKDQKFDERSTNYLSVSFNEHWKWRLKMAEKIAHKTDFNYFAIEAFYVIGSVKNATAGPESDIDLLVHINGNDRQKAEFAAWIDGWSQALAEMVFQNTGIQVKNGLIDLHLITDQDIESKTSYAVMIKSTENSARKLK